MFSMLRGDFVGRLKGVFSLTAGRIFAGMTKERMVGMLG